MNLKEFFGYSKTKFIVFFVFIVLVIIDFYLSMKFHVVPKVGQTLPIEALGGALNNEITKVLFFPIIFVFENLLGLNYFYDWYYQITFTIGFVYLWILSCIVTFLLNKGKKK